MDSLLFIVYLQFNDGMISLGVLRVHIRVRDHLEDRGIDERIILEWIFKKLGGVVDLINLVQDRNRHHARVRAVMKLTVA